MKKIILALVMVLSFSAFAQEMDTTYAVTADGETVGLIHEKGMVPVVPEGMRLVDEVSFVEPEPAPVEEYASEEAPAPQAVRVNRPAAYGKRAQGPLATVDSVEYYQDLVDRYTYSGMKKRSVGKWLMISGGIAAIVGGIMVFDSLSDDNLSGDGEEFLLGYMSAIAGSGAFVTGVIIKSVGNSKLRTAHKYEEKLRRYEDSHAVSLKVAPVVNPVNKSLGGALALNF